jgi:HSP20 family protein
MSEVRVNKIQPEEESLLLLARQVDAPYDEIRRRAFLLFESRGSTHGHDKEDWMEAERQLNSAPATELIEEDNQFAIKMALPGYEPNQLRVNVLPNAVIVEGDAVTVQDQYGTVCFSKLSERKLLRRVDLPQGVRPDIAKAELKDGILRIRVRKVTQSDDRAEQSVAASA